METVRGGVGMGPWRVLLKTGHETWTLLVGEFQTLDGAESWAQHVCEEGGGFGVVSGYAIQRRIDGHWLDAISVEQGAAS